VKSTGLTVDRRLQTKASVEAWARANLAPNATVETCEPLAGPGFDNTIYTATVSGIGTFADWSGPLIFRVAPSPGRHWQMTLEAALHDHVIAAGVPTPRVLAVIPPTDLSGLPIQVLERSPGQPVLTEMTRRPWTTRRHVSALARLLTRIHKAPLPPWAATGAAWTIQASRLTAALELRDTRAELVDDDVARALGTAEKLIHQLDAETVLCHGDYHPGNVLTHSHQYVVVDWTDARIGDRHADVARFIETVELAAHAAPTRLQRRAVRAVAARMKRNFIGSYEAASDTQLSARRLAEWELIHAVHDWATLANRSGTTDDVKVQLRNVRDLVVAAHNRL